MEKDELHNSNIKKHFKLIPVTFLIFGICAIITLPGLFSDSYYYLFSGEPPHRYWWNYFTMVFQHGKVGEAIAIIIHFVLNMSLLFLAGRWTEMLLGSNRFAVLSLTAWGTFILAQWISGIWINGSSGIIWAYSPFLLVLRYTNGKKFATAREMATPLMWIMWVMVTLVMTLLPMLFNPEHSFFRTFIFGNLYHFVAALTGFFFYFAWRKQLLPYGGLH